MTQPDGAMRAISIRKKYKLFRILSLLPLLSLLVFIPGGFTILQSVLSLAFIIIALVFSRLSALWFSNAIRKPLMEELDLAEYAARIEVLKWDEYSPFDILIIAYASGDHQRLLNTVQANIHAVKKGPFRYVFLSYLSISQFMRGDRESLACTLAEMDRLVQEDRRARKLFKKDNLFAFFRHFLNGEYDACEHDCQQALAKPKISAITLLLWEWLPTTVYTERGDTERAKAALTAFLARPKNLPSFVEVAQKQLLGLHDGGGYQGLALRLAADPFATPIPAFVKNLNKNRRSKILLIIAVVLFLLSGVSNTVDDIRTERELIEKVAIAMPGEQAELLARFDVVKDDTIIDDICVLRRANGKILIGTYFVYESDKSTTHFEPYCEDMTSTTILQMPANFDKSYVVHYRLYEKEDYVPRNAHAVAEFDLDGKTFYFCVIKITKQ